MSYTYPFCSNIQPADQVRTKRDIFRNEQELPEGGCYLDFQRFRKSLWDEPEDALVGEYFDGGETINCKVCRVDCI